MASAINYAHPAASEQAEEAIATEVAGDLCRLPSGRRIGSGLQNGHGLAPVRPEGLGHEPLQQFGKCIALIPAILLD